MDNFFQNCPPKMSDGRFITDFESSTRRNDYIRYVNNIWRDDDYRTFLQNNGKRLMDREWKFDRMTHSCWDDSCIFNYPTRSNENIYFKEKAAFDSMFDLRTNKPLAPLRKCQRMPDFRMFSDS